MTDVYTASRPEYRRAQTLAAKPLPLAAGEVAEFRRIRRRGWYCWLACQLIVCAIPVLLIMAIWS